MTETTNPQGIPQFGRLSVLGLSAYVGNLDVSLLRAMMALTDAITAYNNAGQAVLHERHRAGHFNSALPERDMHNPHHAALIQKPRVNHQYGAEIGALDCSVFERNGWHDAPASLNGIAAREAAKWGIAPHGADPIAA